MTLFRELIAAAHLPKGAEAEAPPLGGACANLSTELWVPITRAHPLSNAAGCSTPFLEECESPRRMQVPEGFTFPCYSPISARHLGFPCVMRVVCCS